MTRMRVILTFEYDADPETYPKGSTPKEWAAIDRENYGRQPGLLTSDLADNEYSVVVHPINRMNDDKS